MKKKLILIISALLLVAFSFGAFAGCDLVTPNNERDMAQVVAEVNVAEKRMTWMRRSPLSATVTPFPKT